MCKPILPVVEDELAHIFWKAKHLATVHHHQGVHHAEKEVAEEEHEEKHEQPTTKTSEPVSIHIVFEALYIIPQLTIHKQKFALNICNFSIVSLDKHYPPPKQYYPA